jgi:hypothetical protein
MDNKNTMKELKRLMKKGFVKHHTSKEKGYVSRKGDGYLRKYKGRFGEGYTHHTTNYDSNSFNFITYYVKPKVGDFMAASRTCTSNFLTGTIKEIAESIAMFPSGKSTRFKLEKPDGSAAWHAANEVEFYGA